jgi:hypothetical protein
MLTSADGMELHHRHVLISVINTTKTSHRCGLTNTLKIHYGLNFETLLRSQVFWQEL